MFIADKHCLSSDKQCLSAINTVFRYKLCLSSVYREKQCLSPINNVYRVINSVYRR